MAELSKEDIEFKNRISERIFNLREESGLSQIKFAEKHNIDRQILNRWESKTNKRGVTIHTIRKFCEMIGISIKDFFNSEIFENNYDA